MCDYRVIGKNEEKSNEKYGYHSIKDKVKTLD